METPILKSIWVLLPETTNAGGFLEVVAITKGHISPHPKCSIPGDVWKKLQQRRTHRRGYRNSSYPKDAFVELFLTLWGYLILDTYYSKTNWLYPPGNCPISPHINGRNWVDIVPTFPFAGIWVFILYYSRLIWAWSLISPNIRVTNGKPFIVSQPTLFCWSKSAKSRNVPSLPPPSVFAFPSSDRHGCLPLHHPKNKWRMMGVKVHWVIEWRMNSLFQSNLIWCSKKNMKKLWTDHQISDVTCVTSFFLF